MPKSVRAVLALWIMGLVSSLLPGVAIGQTPSAPDQALARDAEAYATGHGVALDVAVHRLRAQEETVTATEMVRERYRDRLAGISIAHEQDYAIDVLLTGPKPVTDQVVIAGGLLVPIRFHTGAPATRDMIVATIEAHQAAIRADLTHPPAMGLDQRTGSLVVLVNSADLTQVVGGGLAARWATLTGVPVTIRSLDAAEADLSAEGGGRLEGISPSDGRRYVCTAGFVVTDGARTGIATAAHCVDELTYVEPGQQPQPLAFAGQWGWGFQDVQLNLATLPLRPYFLADTAKIERRSLRGWRNRTATRAGDWVCHRGERTGYSCAEVLFTDFAPAGDLCGGACLPRWVAVRGPTCGGGDSGGPVFLGETAFGLVKGGSYRPDGSCALFYYMSVDYLPNGWTLLLAN